MPALSAAKRAQLTDEGYVVVADVLDPAQDLEPVIAEYQEVLDGIAASLYAEGTIRSTYAELPFAERLIQLCAESGRNFPQHFDISLPQAGIQPDTPIHVGPAVFGLLTNPRLLDVVACVCGPELYSNPVQHIRMKLPPRAVQKGSTHGLVTRIPWHQDNGVVLPEADEATILTVWLPLNDATVENGCLQVIPGSHRHGLQSHCPTDKGAAIPERLVPAEQAIPLPMRPGSVLLMHQRTMHSSLDNVTANEVRMSFDLRYQPVGQATGRPHFPGFLARSAAHPETVLRDPAAWAESWYEARRRLSDRDNLAFNRWRAGEGVCA